ncbi:O-acyltransferase like protein [Alosa sapidissima]|uniref:O-acyltransferase like protein n=1 Tax=Alosa sapidissima TaxID=34773 RepID=UPI001C08FF8B|nr:O-acyltransferase like protein [Alosa sapidissima]
MFVHLPRPPEMCMQDTRMFLLELSKDKPAKYAALMYDAFGKLGSDVKGGNVNRPGSLRECLSVSAPGFRGQYCQVFLKQEEVQYFVGICVPDSCTEADVQTLVVYDMLQSKEESLIPPVPSPLLSDSTLGIYMTHCLSTHMTPPDPSAVICLFVCAVLVTVPLVASLYVALLRLKRQRAVTPSPDIPLTSDPSCYGSLLSNGSPASQADNGSPDDSSTNSDGKASEDSSAKSRFLSWLQSLSLQDSSAGVLSLSLQDSSAGGLSAGGLSVGSGSADSYSSLNGIRMLSLLWILSGHNVQLSAWNNLDNAKRWKERVERSPLYVFAFSGPVYLAVDSFLLLGGLLSAKSLLASIQRSEDKLSPGLVTHFLFKRFKRVQPLHLFIVCLAIGLFSVVQRGAFWFIADDEILNCKKYWWSNLLLVNNLFTITDICAPWTWYLSIDFQFYITTPILILLYRWNKRVLAAVAVLLMVLTCLTSALLTAVLRLPVHQPTTLSFESYFQYYYNKPYTRYGPYLVGILAGIYMTTKSGPFVRHRWQAGLGWFSSLSVMMAVVGLAYSLREVPPGPSLPHAIYQGLHRTLWALALAWVILACEEGYGGFVDRILSLSVWIPLSNISFACYLIHPMLIILYNGKRETAIHYTDLNFLYLFLGHTALSLSLGYVLTVLIEKPYLFLKASHGKPH